MEGLIRRCYELMNIELRAGNWEHLDELRNLARMIDIQRRYAIIEERYNDGSHYTKDEHGRFTGSTGAGGGSISLRINLFSKGDPLYAEAFSIEEEDGFEDICCHGNSESVEVIISGKKTSMNAEQFAEHLKSKGYNGGDIRLASCSTGKGDNSFAQNLSKELQSRVKAPDDDVYYIPDDGVLRVGSPYSNTGKWRVFDRGVEVT